MTHPAQPGLAPLHLDSAGHRLFAIACRPTRPAPGSGLLICPPFAEEMNRARRTMRLLAGAAAERGMGVIYPDLHGTGDSDGDFADARWEQWLEDLAAAARWLRASGCDDIVLVGVRAGGLLAWDLLRRGSLSVRLLVLWQPVLSGKSVVTDLLRTRIAAATDQSSRETVSALRQQLAAGTPVEAAGYTLSPALVQSLEAAAFGVDGDLELPPIAWLEVTGARDSPLRAQAATMVAKLREGGASVDFLPQVDPPFWGTVETTVGRGTVERTRRLLAACT